MIVTASGPTRAAAVAALLGAGYLSIMCTTFVGGFVAPTISDANPVYLKNVIALATGRGSVTDDLGALDAFWKFQGLCHLAAGLILGIALFRARVCQVQRQGDSRARLAAEPTAELAAAV